MVLILQLCQTIAVFSYDLIISDIVAFRKSENGFYVWREFKNGVMQNEILYQSTSWKEEFYQYGNY